VTGLWDADGATLRRVLESHVVAAQRVSTESVYDQLQLDTLAHGRLRFNVLHAVRQRSYCPQVGGVAQWLNAGR